jgi:hypothetical protein
MFGTAKQRPDALIACRRGPTAWLVGPQHCLEIRKAGLPAQALNQERG